MGPGPGERQAFWAVRSEDGTEFFIKKAPAKSPRDGSKRELRGSLGEVRAADGHRQRELRDGGAANRAPRRHEGCPAARHQRGVRRGRRGAARTRGGSPHTGRTPQLGGCGQRRVHLHTGHHPLDPGCPPGQLRNHQDPAGPGCHPPRSSRHPMRPHGPVLKRPHPYSLRAQFRTQEAQLFRARVQVRIHGASQAVPGVRDRAARPHPEFVRAGGAPQLRSFGTRLRAGRPYATQQAQTRHQAQAEEVLCTSQRAAAASVHLVRGSSRIPSQERGAAVLGDLSHRTLLPRVLGVLHPGAPFLRREDAQETLHQVHLPFGLIRHLSIFADPCLAAHRDCACGLVWDGRNEKENEVHCYDKAGSTP
ncbi:hypothetical protein NPIL_56211 [Nephila pilipes]|uniref:Uncharacterized protein n=1 Tax=Nephila pilipes TaxID=299642 RepID=A0A8X6NWZ8_NEPPI|nr:hypothetical protein NPIL_56211 [Nephila pilipes]